MGLPIIVLPIAPSAVAAIAWIACDCLRLPAIARLLHSTPGTSLQGPGTDQKQTAKIRRALDKKEPISVVVLNYKRDDTPFWNLVSIDPLKDKVMHRPPPGILIYTRLLCDLEA